MKRPPVYRGYRSPVIAVLGFFMFSISLVLLLTLDLSRVPVWTVPPMMLWMTFLYTGLFITVHDSMHGSILPDHRGLNYLIGAISIFFYALFSYGKLRDKHFKHHKHPASSEDPDYHDGTHKGFLRWYLRFMGRYISPLQILGMAVIFNLLIFLAGLSWVNLLLFWVIPSLGSTLQLFFFGTYLPHREPEGGYANRYHARSNEFPFFLSLVTSYHFGYHLEHHIYPHVQWWRLPFVRRDLQRYTRVSTDRKG